MDNLVAQAIPVHDFDGDMKRDDVPDAQAVYSEVGVQTSSKIVSFRQYVRQTPQALKSLRDKSMVYTKAALPRDIPTVFHLEARTAATHVEVRVHGNSDHVTSHSVQKETFQLNVTYEAHQFRLAPSSQSALRKLFEDIDAYPNPVFVKISSKVRDSGDGKFMEAIAKYKDIHKGRDASVITDVFLSADTGLFKVSKQDSILFVYSSKKQLKYSVRSNDPCFPICCCLPCCFPCVFCCNYNIVSSYHSSHEPKEISIVLNVTAPPGEEFARLLLAKWSGDAM